MANITGVWPQDHLAAAGTTGDHAQDADALCTTVLSTTAWAGAVAEARELYAEVMQEGLRISQQRAEGGCEAGEGGPPLPVRGLLVACKMNLATLLRKDDDAPTAKALLQEVVAARLATLPARHPETCLAQMNLANLLFQNEGGVPESVREAERLYREVVIGQGEQLGPSHAKTLQTKINLAILLQREGGAQSLAEAAELTEEACAGLTEHLGEEHPRTRQAVGLWESLRAETGAGHTAQQA